MHRLRRSAAWRVLLLALAGGCTVGAHHVGDPCEDDCYGPNLACVEVPGPGPDRVCMRQCEDTERPCDDGSICGFFGSGVSAPVCYLGGPAREGEACGRWTNVCARGLRCSFAHDRCERPCYAGLPGWECPRGQECLGVCVTVCDTTAECPDGLLCFRWPMDRFGYCVRPGYHDDCDYDGVPDCDPSMFCTEDGGCAPPL